MLCDSQTPTVSNADRENWRYEKQHKFSGQGWRTAAVFQLLLPAGPVVVLFWKRQTRGGRVLSSRSQH